MNSEEFEARKDGDNCDPNDAHADGQSLLKREPSWPRFRAVPSCIDQLSSSSTDARVAENSNVPIHLQAGKSLDIAGQEACRVYTFLLVVLGIFRPTINHLLTGILLFF